MFYWYIPLYIVNIYVYKGCIRHDMYGSQCNIPCPMNCKDNVCHIVNGTCKTCEPGLTGDFCEKRKSLGRYRISWYQDYMLLISESHKNWWHSIILYTGGCSVIKRSFKMSTYSFESKRFANIAPFLSCLKKWHFT